MNTATSFPAYFFQRLSSDPRFMAYVLAEDLKVQMIEVDEQAADLETSLENRLHLGTCFAPDPKKQDFQARIEQIAGTLKVNGETLAEMVARVAKAQRFRNVNYEQDTSFADQEVNLMAAREKEDED